MSISLLHLRNRLVRWPGGVWLFGKLVCRKAPYFASIAPRITALHAGHGEATMRHRRAVTNHIGTVHAIAIANGMECAMGLLAEATTPDDMRWIPKGITLDYVAKTPGDIVCVAETTPEDWDKEPPFQVDVKVTGRLVKDGTVAVEGIIPIYVSAKKKK